MRWAAVGSRFARARREFCVARAEPRGGRPGARGSQLSLEGARPRRTPCGCWARQHALADPIPGHGVGRRGVTREEWASRRAFGVVPDLAVLLTEQIA